MLALFVGIDLDQTIGGVLGISLGILKETIEGKGLLGQDDHTKFITGCDFPKDRFPLLYQCCSGMCFPGLQLKTCTPNCLKNKHKSNFNLFIRLCL